MDSCDNRVLDCSGPQALSILQDATYGQHILIIYDSIVTLRQLYSAYAFDKVNKKEEYILVLPYLETPESVRIQLEDKGVSKKEQQRDGAFLVIDASEWFFGSENSQEQLMARMLADITHHGRQGASIFRDLGVFFLYDAEAKLMELETTVSGKGNLNCKLICCINSGDFERLTESNKEILFSVHDKTLGITSRQNVMFEEALALSVSEAMSIYGRQISQVLKTQLERQFSISTETPANNPRVLVEALESTLDSGARIVEKRILRSLYSRIGLNVPQSPVADLNGEFLK